MRLLDRSEHQDSATGSPSETGGPRYAIYYTPAPEHSLTVAAREWLGRDAFAPGTQITDVADENRMVSEPRRYGFHATIKAPFRLRQGASVETLEQALRGFATKVPTCPIGPLKIDLIGGFFALVPVQPLPTLRGFAARVVEEFDPFRAPMDAKDLERRMSRSLDEAEMTNLVTWGYPYVGDRFRFHMTLTDRIPEESHDAMRARLEEVFAPNLAEDFRIDALSLFVQENRDANFVVRSQFALKAPAALKTAV